MTNRLLPLVNVVNKYRPSLFSSQEWWFHLLAASVLLPIGCYVNFGPRYLTDPAVFLVGTICGFVSYVVSITTLTLLIKHIIAQYPTYQQTIQRTLVMTILVNGTALSYTCIEYYFFTRFTLFQGSFSWQALQVLCLICFFFVTLFCIVINLFYAQKHWKEEQLEIQSLKREALQRQYDQLKQQLNPHFLFNSLSSISALVGEDTAEAERFVDDLSKVYRYILQATRRELVTLPEELTFIQNYARLLQIRYGNSLRFELPTAPLNSTGLLPTLSLQTLIDNALKHNQMSATQPLLIQLTSVDGSAIRVVNTLQRKTRIVDTIQRSLTNLTLRYTSFTHTPVLIEETDKIFSVTLPLVELDTQDMAHQ
ncbi:sensor histidine kinase [Spirosoma harenae]